MRLLELELHEDSPAFMLGEAAQVNVPVAVNADSLATWFVPAAITFAPTAPVLLQLSVDDEGHTAQWLRGGKVLAAVTADEKPAAGCNSHSFQGVAVLPVIWCDRQEKRDVVRGTGAV